MVENREAFKLALHYRFGKPMTVVLGPEEQPPIKIDISAIPKFHKPAMMDAPRIALKTLAEQIKGRSTH